MTVGPALPEIGTTAASEVSENPEAVSGCDSEDFFPALTSSGGLSRTINRLPEPSQEWPYGASRSRTTRVTGGLFWNWRIRIAVMFSF